MLVRRALPALLVVILAGLVAVAGAQAPKTADKPLDVPYVPTKLPVLDKMLEMVKVKKDDVLYDLGCGDGRIVITAAQRYGIRGVGVDIDPERIAEANANAKKAGVADKVKFVRGDLFEADIKDATIVTLYLLPDVNMRLRPKLLSDLRPGTRVVSHNYDMGDWAPEQTATVVVEGTEHTVYAWTVPKKAARK